MEINLTELLKAVSGEKVGGEFAEPILKDFSTDTRQLKKGDVFFALKGERFDGHDFIQEATAKGVDVFVVAETFKIPSKITAGVTFIRVKDTLAAYGDLAKFWRQKFRTPTVAITGSAGKTTVKELVAHILSTRFSVLKNKGTENNLVGVPKTILQQKADHEILVLEMGTSLPGEIDRLSSIVSPRIGAVTQIAAAHLEGLKSLEGIKTEKLSILPHIERGGTLFLNGQDPMLMDVSSGVHRVERLSFSREGGEWAADQLWCREEGGSFRVRGEMFETKLLGKHNALNALFAIAIAHSFGMSMTEIKKALESFRPVAGRLDFKNIEGVYFLDDSYNSNPASFKAALEVLGDLKMRERKAVVCGDMLELGEKSEEYHREIGWQIAQSCFDYVIAAGNHSKYLVDAAIKQGFDSKRIHHVKDSREAGTLCREIATAGDRILVKGSRGMKMEKVFECFITSSTR